MSINVQQFMHDNPETVKAGTDALQQVLARSTTDKEFRSQLLTDPRAALASVSGQPVDSISSDFNIVFIENRADATIVLPDYVDPAAELSETELETVAGGTDPVTSAALGLTVAVISLVAATFQLYNAFHDHDKHPAQH
ncbi:hypothetical protein [Gemmatimonas sp.]|jgi:hypothetical protein|uniref:hypothetical protein n=1 Tax=Gemmatimonas sp. TaxID=1962908 RepID=UPI0037C099BA